MIVILITSNLSVEKIVTFVKAPALQALIQMADVSQGTYDNEITAFFPIDCTSTAVAIKAKQEMDQQYIYPNCCFMRIEFSKNPDVTVKHNNEKSRFA